MPSLRSTWGLPLYRAFGTCIHDPMNDLLRGQSAFVSAFPTLRLCRDRGVCHESCLRQQFFRPQLRLPYARRWGMAPSPSKTDDNAKPHIERGARWCGGYDRFRTAASERSFIRHLRCLGHPFHGLQFVGVLSHAPTNQHYVTRWSVAGEQSDAHGRRGVDVPEETAYACMSHRCKLAHD